MGWLSDIVAKASQQLGFTFKPRDPVKSPGSRGGKFYRTDEGEVRYGERPKPKWRGQGDLFSGPSAPKPQEGVEDKEVSAAVEQPAKPKPAAIEDPKPEQPQPDVSADSQPEEEEDGAGWKSDKADTIEGLREALAEALRHFTDVDSLDDQTVDNAEKLIALLRKRGLPPEQLAKLDKIAQQVAGIRTMMKLRRRQKQEQGDAPAKPTRPAGRPQLRRAKRDLVAVPDSERPEKAKKYGEGEYVPEVWEVLEADLIDDQLRRQRERAERMGRQFAPDETRLAMLKDSLRTEYQQEVKKAISKGMPVPVEVIEQYPEFSKARSARQRYEKGWRTSFANRSAAVHEQELATRGYKVKRQDGKPIPQVHIDEINQGMDELEEILGPTVRDLMRRADITIAHTNGKYPFLSQAGGVFHATENTITIGIRDRFGRPIPALAHEWAHWLDYEAGSCIGADSMVGKGQNMRRVTALSEMRSGPLVGDSKLIDEARWAINESQVVGRSVKMKLKDAGTKEQEVVIERMKVQLGPYWRERREVWARLVEQYVTTMRGKGGVASEGDYTERPGWWDAETFARFAPRVGQEIARRIAILGGDASKLTGEKHDLDAVAQQSGFDSLEEARLAIARDIGMGYDGMRRRAESLEKQAAFAMDRMRKFGAEDPERMVSDNPPPGGWRQSDFVRSAAERTKQDEIYVASVVERAQGAHAAAQQMKVQLKDQDERVANLSPEMRAAILNSSGGKIQRVAGEDVVMAKATLFGRLAA